MLAALHAASVTSLPSGSRTHPRRAVVLGGITAGFAGPSGVLASIAPSDEVAKVLLEPWDDEPPFGKGGFRRLDETDDALFYSTSRFVLHVDDAAIAACKRFYTQTFQELAAERQQPLDVLDLCSSWVSHFPDDGADGVRFGRVAGLGMNAEELSANKQLSEWVVRDLNKQPVLPYADGSFDAVTCTVSIDYLTQPLALMREVARVLRPGGRVAVLISNRLFFSKAVALWTGKDDLEHVRRPQHPWRTAAAAPPPTHGRVASHLPPSRCRSRRWVRTSTTGQGRPCPTHAPLTCRASSGERWSATRCMRSYRPNSSNSPCLRHTKFYIAVGTLISLVFIYIYVNREARAGERPSRETEARAAPAARAPWREGDL